MEEIEVSEVFPVSQKELYQAWLDRQNIVLLPVVKQKLSPKKVDDFRHGMVIFKGKQLN
jgi:hypothetical protein